MTRTTVQQVVNPKLLAKIVPSCFIIHIITIFATHITSAYHDSLWSPLYPIYLYAFAVMLNAAFATYFFSILYKRSASVAVLNTLMIIFLAIAILLLIFSFNGNLTGVGLWFGERQSLIKSIMGFIFFTLLLVMTICIAKKIRCSYRILTVLSTLIVITGLIFSTSRLFECDYIISNMNGEVVSCGMVAPLVIRCIQFVSDLALGIGYTSMALFLGEYGVAIKTKKEAKNAKSK